MKQRRTFVSPSALSLVVPPAKRALPASQSQRCPLCDRVFTLAEVRRTRVGGHLHCPTVGCPGTPEIWVHPDNPLTSTAAWRDWQRMIARVEKRLRHPRIAA